MKFPVIKLITYSLFFTCYISSALGQEESLDNLFFQEDTQIFSLSKKSEDAFDAAAAVYVISSNDIRRSGVTSIPEALRLAPGVNVARQGSHKWAVAIRGFNHQYSNKLLILFDGRIVYSPVFSGAFWDIQDYLIEDIDKIEVIRGPGGTIWGSNAVNGVINIITKNSAQTRGGYISTTHGNLAEGSFEARYGKKIKDNLFYRIYAKSSKNSDLENLNSKQDSRDDWRHDRGGFRVDLNGENEQLSIHGDVHSSRANNYFNILPDSNSNSNIIGEDLKQAQGGNIVLKWEKTISQKSKTYLQFYADYDKFRADGLKRSAYTYDIDFQHVFQGIEKHQFVWGVNYRLVDDNMVDGTHLKYPPPARRDDTISAFLQDKITLKPNKLFLTIGSKFEHNDYTYLEYQPSIKLAFYPQDNQTLWAAVSRAVRTPTRAEDGFTLPISGGTNGFTSLKGSGQYESEKLLSYEVGYRIKPNDKSEFDFTAFYNKYHNLQTFETAAGDGGDNEAFLIADNLGDGESIGFESVARFFPSQDWKLEATYSFSKLDIDIDSRSTDFFLHLEENNLPQNQFKVASYYNLSSRIELDNILYYVDNIDGDIDEYYRYDLIISYKLDPNLRFSFAGKNLLEDEHQEYGASLYSNAVEVPRSYHLKIDYKF